jgi:hypothetical protein
MVKEIEYFCSCIPKPIILLFQYSSVSKCSKVKLSPNEQSIYSIPRYV